MSDALRIKRNVEKYRKSVEDVAGEPVESKVILEMYSNIVRDLLQVEDEGWLAILGGMDETKKGFTLKDVQESTAYLEKATKTNGSLLGRGLRLKNNHAFGRGFTYERNGVEKIQPRYQTLIDSQANQDALFSASALKALNRVIFTSGNPMMLWDTKKKEWSKVPIDVQIEEIITEDSDATKIKYFLRSYSKRNDVNVSDSLVTIVREWIPNATYWLTKPTFPDTISIAGTALKVRKDLVIVHRAFNNDNGETWGVPDAFSAAPWATIYANYLRDHAKLARALATISYLVKAKTEAAARSAGAKLSNGRVGQAAITGPDTSIDSIPRANSIDMYTGRPLVAMVASALDVSTTGITSDPGPGGSYASENALSQPEQMAALSRQEDFASYLSLCFRVMGADDITINFRRLDSDPIHRSLQSLRLAYDGGAIHQSELRARVLELLDIDPLDDGLPEPNEFIWAKKPILPGFLTDDDELLDLNSTDAATGGNSSGGANGGTGSLDDDGGNDARNSDRDAGTA